MQDGRKIRTGSVAVGRVDPDALRRTVQIYPGNQRDRTAFIFEFDVASTLKIHLNFPDRLRAFRRDSTLKGKVLDKLAGLSVNTCHRLESGRNAPTWATVEKLAHALHVDPNLLLWGEHGSLAARVAEIRKRKGLTQVGLSRLAGLKESSINEIELGHIKCPKESTLVKIAKALFVGLEQLCPGGVPWKKQ